MARTTRLTVNRHGVYTFRFLVPKHLKNFFGCQEVQKSLGTKDYGQAKLLSAKLNYQVEILLDSMNKKLLSDVALSPEKLRELKMKFPNGVEIDFDPGKPEETAFVNDLVSKAFGKPHPIDAVAPIPIHVPPPDLKAVTRQVLDEVEQSKAEESPLLADVLDKWKRVMETKLAAKSFSDYVGHVEQFIGHCHARRPALKRIGAITRAEAVRYREKLDETLKVQTTDKKMQVLKQFFDFATKRDYYKLDNPFAGLQELTKSQRDKVTESYEPFTLDELQVIFNPDKYLAFNNKPHFFWVPFLGLLTGARIEEICQLEVHDMKQQEGMVVLDINDGYSVDGTKKRTKTDHSNRQIPLHSQLLSLGFLDYVEDIRRD